MLKREAIDDDLSSQIFKQAHVLFKAIAQWSHILFEVASVFLSMVLQRVLKIHNFRRYYWFFLSATQLKSIGIDLVNLKKEFEAFLNVNLEKAVGPLCIAAIEIAWHCHWTGPSSVIHSPLA